MARPVFDLRPMSTGDILDRTIRIYRRDFLHNLAIVAIPYLIVIPLALLFQSNQPTPGNPRAFLRPAILGPLAILGLAYAWLSFMSMGALARSVSERFLGESPTVSASYQAVLRRTLSLIWAYFLAFLVWGGLGVVAILSIVLAAALHPVVGVAAAIAIVGVGLVFFLRFLLVTQVIVIENVRGRAALQRSWNLMRGNFWRGALIFLFMVVLGIIFGVVLGIPAGLLIGWIGGLGGRILEQVVNQLANILMMPIAGIAFTLVYYNSRIRNEGFDLEMMAQNLGVPAAPAAVASTGTPEPPLAQEPAPPPARPAPAPRAPTGSVKTCPQCGTQMPMIRPYCPKCQTRVPYRSAR